MELNYLREFVALAQSCQFQETADELFMSQSSLSKHIKVIERELGAELLNRSTRRVELSEFGRAFLPYAAQIAALQREYMERLLGNTSEKKLKIGIAPIVTLFTLEQYLSTFAEDHPDYQVEFVEANEQELRSMLQKGECDLIVVSRNPLAPDTEFCSQVYSTDILVAVLAETHPLAGKESVTIQELEAYAFVQKGHTNFARLLDPAIPPSSYTASRGSVLMNLIRNQIAVAVLPRYATKYYMRNDRGIGIKTLRLEPQTTFYLDLLYPKAKQNTPAVQSLVEYLQLKEEHKNPHGKF